MRRFLPLAAFAALAACADSEPPGAVPTGDGGTYNLVDPVNAPLADEAEPAIGQWIQLMQDERPVLQFGPPNTEPLFSIACDDRAGGIDLNRHGTLSSNTGEMMTVTIGSARRDLAVNPAQGPLPRLRASVSAQDDLLTQIGNAQEPIRISLGDGPPLVLPAGEEIAPFIRNCANPVAAEQAAAPAPAASDNATATNETNTQ